MKKVLLICEDYNESTRFQAIFKKVGFDTSLANSVARLSSEILNVNPDIVVSMGSAKVSSLAALHKLREINFFKGKTVAVLSHGDRPQPADLAKAKADVLLEAPVSGTRMIEVLAKLLQMESVPLLEKYKRANIHETQALNVGPSEMHIVRGQKPLPEEIMISDRARVDRYQKFVQDVHIDTNKTSHDRQAVKTRQNELKKSWDLAFLDQLDKLKRQFAAALFKK